MKYRNWALSLTHKLDIQLSQPTTLTLWRLTTHIWVAPHR